MTSTSPYISSFVFVISRSDLCFGAISTDLLNATSFDSIQYSRWFTQLTDNIIAAPNVRLVILMARNLSLVQHWCHAEYDSLLV